MCVCVCVRMHAVCVHAVCVVVVVAVFILHVSSEDFALLFRA